MCVCICHLLYPRSCGTLQQALALVEEQRPAETQKDVDSISEATTLPFLGSQIKNGYGQKLFEKTWILNNEYRLE